jgi:hypothetical protein
MEGSGSREDTEEESKLHFIQAFLWVTYHHSPQPNPSIQGGFGMFGRIVTNSFLHHVKD